MFGSIVVGLFHVGVGIYLILAGLGAIEPPTKQREKSRELKRHDWMTIGGICLICFGIFLMTQTPGR